jgi:hypothetical protein
MPLGKTNDRELFLRGWGGWRAQPENIPENIPDFRWEADAATTTLMSTMVKE